MQEHSIVYEKIVRWLKNNALIAKFKKKSSTKVKAKIFAIYPPKNLCLHSQQLFRGCEISAPSSCAYDSRETTPSRSLVGHTCVHRAAVRCCRGRCLNERRDWRYRAIKEPLIKFGAPRLLTLPPNAHYSTLLIVEVYKGPLVI